MRGLLLSAVASAVLAFGGATVSTTPAQAYAKCLRIGYYTYCVAKYYNPRYCVYRDNYIYCRPH